MIKTRSPHMETLEKITNWRLHQYTISSGVEQPDGKILEKAKSWHLNEASELDKIIHQDNGRPEIVVLTPVTKEKPKRIASPGKKLGRPPGTKNKPKVTLVG